MSIFSLQNVEGGKRPKKRTQLCQCGPGQRLQGTSCKPCPKDQYQVTYIRGRTIFLCFRQPSEPNLYFFAKIDRRIFFNNMFLQEKRKQLTERNFFFGGHLDGFFFQRPSCSEQHFFFVLHHAIPQMIND